MAWNDKVLDNLEQLYWSPKKLGLNSVECAPTEDKSGFVVPREAVVGEPRVYLRSSSFREWRAGIHRDEEILNQMIEIALGIAPAAFLARAFFAPLGIETFGPIEVIGREVRARHEALAPQQYTQHDGFYVAPEAIVAMEMKLGARTSIEQLLKYCTQIALEEITHGRKAHVGLIYLVPSTSADRTRSDLALDDPAARAQLWEDPLAHTDKSRLRKLLRRHAGEIREVAKRLQLGIITWDNFLDTLIATRESARVEGNETLSNLMDGLIAQIRATPGCGLSRT